MLIVSWLLLPLMSMLAPHGVHCKVFLPVTTSSMPASETSGWEKCDKTLNPTAPACSCPCNSKLVTVTQYYPGHRQCLDPSLKIAKASSAVNPSIAISSGEGYTCPSNFNTVGSSGHSCTEQPIEEFVAVASTSTAALELASLYKSDPFVLLRCDCFTKCQARSDCHHVIFVADADAPKCQLYSETCTINSAPDNNAQQQLLQQHASGLSATLFRKNSDATKATAQTSTASCKSLGWELTDTGLPQTLCSAAGVCSIKKHASILPSGRCSRRCSGDVTLEIANTFCSSLGARLCKTSEILTMNIDANALSCGGDFRVLSDVPVWTTGQCTAQNYVMKKAAASCLPNPLYNNGAAAAVLEEESNEIPFGAVPSLHDCVTKCAMAYSSATSHKGCRYVRHDGEQCWMVTTSSMNSCLSNNVVGEEEQNVLAMHLFVAGPEHVESTMYEIFAKGHEIITLDKGSNQFRTSCRGINYASDAFSNKAYAFCCADRWPTTLPLFHSRGETLLSSSSTEGTTKQNRLSTQGRAGVWSSDKQTRFKSTSPMSTAPTPTWSVAFLDGIQTSSPMNVDKKELSIEPYFGGGKYEVAPCEGPNGGKTAIDTASGAGMQVFHGGQRGFPVGTSWTMDVFVQGRDDGTFTSGWNTLTRGNRGDHHLIHQGGKLGIYGNIERYGFKEFENPGMSAVELLGDARWKRLTMVTIPGKTTLYVDGVFKGETPYASSSDIYFVGMYGSNQQSWGKIAQFRYFNSALTATEIANFARCHDTTSWNNGFGDTCAIYATERCTNGEPNAAASQWFGDSNKFPSRHCCACGKKSDSTMKVTFPEMKNPALLSMGEVMFVHGPFGPNRLEENVVVSAMPPHTHLHITASFYDTRSYDFRVSDVCAVTVEFERFGILHTKTYAGSDQNSAITSSLNLIDIGDVSTPRFNILVRRYQECKIHVLVPHNESTVKLKFGPTSSVGRRESDLWALGRVEYKGRTLPSDSTDKSVSVVAEYENVYEDSQEWSINKYGKTCVSSSCPEIAGKFCAPTVPGFCNGTSYNCVNRAKAWCLQMEENHHSSLCFGISHTIGDRYVKLCVPAGNGVLQMQDELNSVMVKRYSSVKEAEIIDGYEWTLDQSDSRCHATYAPDTGWDTAQYSALWDRCPAGFTPVSDEPAQPSFICESCPGGYEQCLMGGICRCEVAAGISTSRMGYHPWEDRTVSLEACRMKCLADVGAANCDYFSLQGENGPGCYYSTSGCNSDKRESAPGWQVWSFKKIEPLTGYHRWNGNLMGRHAIITVEGSTEYLPSHPVKMNIPCGSGDVTVRRSEAYYDENCEAEDTCVVNVADDCRVKVWMRDRCSSVRDTNTWSELAGPGATVSSSAHCIVTVASDSVDTAGQTMEVQKPHMSTQTTAMGWAKNPSDECSGTRKSQCDGAEETEGKCRTIRGPFTDYYETTFTDLPEHHAIRVRLRFIRGDYWWWHERGWLEIDGHEYRRSKMEANMVPTKGGLWGPERGCHPNTKYEDIDIMVLHTGTTLQIKAVGSLRDYYYERGWRNQWASKQFYIDRFKVQMVKKIIEFPTVSNQILSLNTPKLIYTDAKVINLQGEFNSKQVMGVHTEGWSSHKTLAYRWASSPDQEVSSLLETCNGESAPMCRVAHGPFSKMDGTISRVFENLGTHTQLTLSLRYWVVDSWDHGEMGGVNIDGVTIWEYTHSTRIKCDNDWNLGYYEPWDGSGGSVCYHDVKLTIDHSANVAEVSVWSTINGRVNDESWGFSDVFVYVLATSENNDVIMPPRSKVVWADMLTNLFVDQLEDGTVQLPGWSSEKTLAHGWGSFDEEIRTLKEECDEEALPGCRLMHGPFDGDTREISRTFANLESHKKLALSLRMFRIDSWDRNDEVFVELWNVPEVPYTLIKEDNECGSGDNQIGTYSSLIDCARQCARTEDCKYFVYGKGESAGKCYHESTASSDCSEGWLINLYDFYELDEKQPASFTAATPASCTNGQLLADSSGCKAVTFTDVVPASCYHLTGQLLADSTGCKIVTFTAADPDTSTAASCDNGGALNINSDGCEATTYSPATVASCDNGGVLNTDSDGCVVTTYVAATTASCNNGGAVNANSDGCDARSPLVVDEKWFLTTDEGDERIQIVQLWVNGDGVQYKVRYKVLWSHNRGRERRSYDMNLPLLPHVELTNPFRTETIAPSQVFWNDLSCTDPWKEYVQTGSDDKETPGNLYQPWAGSRGAVCFSRVNFLVDHEQNSFKLTLRHTLSQNHKDEWFGFDDVRVSLALGESGEEQTSTCPGAACASVQCQKAPGEESTAMLLGFCNPLTGCDPSMVSSAEDRKSCETWAITGGQQSTCVPTPALIAPETNAGSCSICDGDFQCNRNVPFAPIHFVDPLRSNDTDPIKGRLVTKLEIVTHGSMSADSPDNFGIFQWNGRGVGKQFGVGPEQFGPRCNDCFQSKPVIVAGNDFYSYAGKYNEGPGDGNNTVNFTVPGDQPWCVSKVEIRICAKPGPPQIHRIHVISGAAEPAEDDADVQPPDVYDNTILDPAGNEWIWFQGQNFLPMVDAVTYGPKSEGYSASNCTMYQQGTLVRCLTEPGTGGPHVFKIWANGNSNSKENDCLESLSVCNVTYAPPRILTVSPQRGPTAGSTMVLAIVKNIGEKDASASVRMTFGTEAVPAAAGFRSGELLFFLPSLTSRAATLTRNIWMQVESYRTPHGSMGIGMSNLVEFTYDPPSIEGVFVRFDEGFKNIFLTAVGLNFGGNLGVSDLRVCHEGYTRDISSNFNYTGCFTPAVTKYTHTEIEMWLGDDVASNNGGGPFPGNVTIEIGGHSSVLRYFGRTPIIEEETIERLSNLKFATDGRGTPESNRVSVAVKYAGSDRLDIKVAIFLKPLSQGGVENENITISQFKVDADDAERVTFDVVIPQGQGKGVLFCVKRGSQRSEYISIDYAEPSVMKVIASTLDTSGSVVTIIGENFGVQTPHVSILGANGEEAGECQVITNSHTNIECQTPNGRGTNVYSVFVKSANQWSAVLAYAGLLRGGLPQVTYMDPIITKIITPEERSTSGQFVLRIVGENFGGNETTLAGGDASGGQGVEISVGYRLCAPIVRLTHTSVECIVPETEGGVDNGIRVVVLGRFSSGTVEQASDIARLSFSKPVIESIQGWPSSGMPTAGGRNITVIGRNFGLAHEPVTRMLKIGAKEYQAQDIQLAGSHTVRLTVVLFFLCFLHPLIFFFCFSFSNLLSACRLWPHQEKIQDCPSL